MNNPLTRRWGEYDIVEIKKSKLFEEFRLISCGGRTRTCDLQVMSLASYQLLHSAIFNCVNERLVSQLRCKGTAFFRDSKIFYAQIVILRALLTYINL